MGTRAAFCLLLTAVGLQGSPITFTGSLGSRAASAMFAVSGSELVITLRNTSTADVLVPSDVLTAMFFNLAGNPALGMVSAAVPAGSFTVRGGAPVLLSAPLDVGGEWAYRQSGTPLAFGGAQGLSSTGLGIFGPHDVFPGVNLEGPTSPGGLEYGLLPAADNPATGNRGVSGKTLVQGATIFRLSGLAPGFDLAGPASVTAVTFMYGTALNEGHIPGQRIWPYTEAAQAEIPEPATLTLLASGLAGLVLWRARRAG
jgi:hypothetical protein